MPLSPFATALKAVLDVGFFEGRAEWARCISTTETALEAWTSDQEFPTAYALGMIYQVVRDSRVPRLSAVGNKVYPFLDLLDMPIEDVTPFAKRIGCQLAWYIQEGVVAFGRRLRDLPSNDDLRYVLTTNSWK